MKNLLVIVYVLFAASVVMLVFALSKKNKETGGVYIDTNPEDKNTNGIPTKTKGTGTVSIPPEPSTPCAGGWKLRWVNGRPLYYCPWGLGDVKSK